MKWVAAAASAAATAVASAASSAAGERRAYQCSNSTRSPSMEDSSSRTAGATADDRFAPRFDGLRFIETLVTAHR